MEAGFGAQIGSRNHRTLSSDDSLTAGNTCLLAIALVNERIQQKYRQVVRQQEDLCFS